MTFANALDTILVMVACSVVIDLEACREAAIMLGLEHTKLNIYEAPRAVYHGAIRVIRGEIAHHIGMPTYAVSPQAVSRLIWHELTHALQLERDFDLDHDRLWKTYTEQVRDTQFYTEWHERQDKEAMDEPNQAYWATPMEAEAKENEAFGDLYLLATFPQDLTFANPCGTM